MHPLIEHGFETKLLDRDVHARLIQDIDRIVRRAAVPLEAVCTPLSRYCGEQEIEWVKQIKKHIAAGKFGAMYHGDQPQIERRMMWIAGACIRNFIDARVVSLLDVLQGVKSGDDSTPTITLVPNFYVEGLELAKWQVQQLHDWLISRMIENKVTIVYVENRIALQKAYGSQIANHLTQYEVLQ